MTVFRSLFAWTIAAAAFHFFSIQTSIGVVRIELAFFLAYRCALLETRPWEAAFTFVIPSLLFDALDNQFAGTPSHVLVFLLVRRLKGFSDLSRLPASALSALIFAAVDRLLFGALIGFRIGVGPDMMGSALLDPAYLLTALLLPFGLIRLGAATGRNSARPV